MGSIAVVGEYTVLGRCNDIDGIHVHAARRSSDEKGDQLFSLHHFPFVNPSAEAELRALCQATRELDDPILVAPREIVRTPEGLFVVTDFIAGETIEHIVKTNRAAISKILAVAIGRDIARAVERAKDETRRAMFGDVTSAQILISYDTGDLKLIMIGAPLVHGRSVLPTTKSIGSLVYEMLAGKKHSGTPQPPKAGADLDRIVLNAISYASSEVGPLSEELDNYLRTRTITSDRSADLTKLIQQYFSHKSTAMRALVQRWRSAASPRTTSFTSRTPSIPPARRASSIRRPITERGLEAPLAELDIPILDPQELVATEDISSASLRRGKRPSEGWPRLRIAFFLFLLSLSCATAALVLANGEGRSIAQSWSALFADSQQLSKELLSSFR